MQAFSQQLGNDIQVTFCSRSVTVGLQPGEGISRLKARVSEAFGLTAAFELHHGGAPVRTDEEAGHLVNREVGCADDANWRDREEGAKRAVPELSVVADDCALLDLERAHEAAGSMRVAFLQDMVARLRQQVADSAQPAAEQATQFAALESRMEAAAYRLAAFESKMEAHGAAENQLRSRLESLSNRFETEKMLSHAALCCFEERLRAQEAQTTKVAANAEAAAGENSSTRKAEVDDLRDTLFQMRVEVDESCGDIRAEMGEKLQLASEARKTEAEEMLRHFRQEISAEVRTGLRACKMSAEVQESSMALRAAADKFQRDVDALREVDTAPWPKADLVDLPCTMARAPAPAVTKRWANKIAAASSSEKLETAISLPGDRESTDGESMPKAVAHALPATHGAPVCSEEENETKHESTGLAEDAPPTAFSWLVPAEAQAGDEMKTSALDSGFESPKSAGTVDQGEHRLSARDLQEVLRSQMLFKADAVPALPPKKNRGVKNAKLVPVNSSSPSKLKDYAPPDAPESKHALADEAAVATTTAPDEVATATAPDEYANARSDAEEAPVHETKKSAKKNAGKKKGR